MARAPTRPAQMPGEDPQQGGETEQDVGDQQPGAELDDDARIDAAQERLARAGVDALNNTGKDPNTIAREREQQLQMTAAIAAGGKPDLAPTVAVDPAPSVRIADIGGQQVRVHIGTIRRNDHVAKYGPESRLPKGTPVKRDGTPCEGDEQPYGIIGDIELPGIGRLVSRVIPFDAMGGEAA